MKSCSIGDLHGRDIWKKVIPMKDNYDKIIFMADFCDSYDLSNAQILHNLREIIEFKKDNFDKIILLIGNHDTSYFYFPDYYCEGFRAEAYPALQILFNDHKDLFQVSYQYKNYLWTHAGVTNKWLSEFKPMAEERKIWDDGLPLSDILNMSNETSLRDKLFQKSGWRLKPINENLNGGIIWADISETRKGYLEGYHQIVGHTPIFRNTTVQHKKSSITYIDSLAHEDGEFYEREIN